MPEDINEFAYFDTIEEGNNYNDSLANSIQKTNDIDEDPAFAFDNYLAEEGIEDETFTEGINPPQSVAPRVARKLTETQQPDAQESEDPNIFLDLATQGVGGIRDATQEYINAAEDLGNWIGKKVGEQIWDDGTDIHTDVNLFRGILPEVPQSNRLAGQIERGMVQFLVGFIPSYRALKYTAMGTAAKGVAASFISDVAVFDPHQERFANFLAEYPMMRKVGIEYLMSKPGETVAEGRLKNAIESLGVSAVLGGAFMAGAKALKGAKTTSTALARGLRNVRGGVKAVEDSAEKSAAVLADGLQNPMGKMGIASEDIKVPVEEPQASPIYGSNKPILKVSPKETIVTTEADIQAIDSIKIEIGEKALNINPEKITDEKDLQDLMVKVSKHYEKFGKLDKVQTNEQTRELADKLGMSVETLLSRKEGGVFNAAELVASTDMLNSSLTNIKGLAKKIHSPDVSDKDRIAFRKAMDLHAAIQYQVSGLKKEAGRALQSGRIQAKTQKEQLRAMQDMINNRGGYGSIDDMSERVLMLDDEKELNNFIQRNHRSTGFDMITELFTNNILSGPSTNTINIMSTASHTALQVPERALAGVMNKITGKADGVQIQESLAMAQSLPKGIESGLAVAREIWRTEGTIDPITKFTGIDRRAITATNLSKTFLGRNTIDPVLKAVNAKTLAQDGIAANLVNGYGTLLRGVSTRPMVTADGFFKGLSYTMETYAVATRKGIQEGHIGQSLDDRVRELIANPTEDMRISAKNFAEEVTFTEPNKYARGISKLTRDVPIAKIAVPFTNTMSNIVKQTMTRTPAGLISANVRAELSGANGKVAQDIAKSRMTMGTGLLWMGVLAASNGKVTGGLPVDPELRRAALDANFQPYSFVLEDENGVKTYVPFENIEPIGPLFGIGADIVQISNDVSEKEMEDIIAETAGAFYNHVSSKLWVASVAESFDALKDPKRGGKKMNNLVASLAVPNLVNKINQQIDPYLRQPNDVWDSVKSRLPGASTDVPIRRNFFGEPIVRRFEYTNNDGTVDAVNMFMPGYKETENPDQVIQEIYDNGIELSMPSQTYRFGGASVKLTTGEYNDRLKVQGEVLKSKLEQLVNSPQYITLTGGPNGGKAMVMKQLITRVRTSKELDAKWLQDNPQIYERWTLEAEKAQEQLTGGSQ